MVLVDRKTDGIQDEISPDTKIWVKTKSLISVYPFSIPGKNEKVNLEHLPELAEARSTLL